MVVLVGYKVGFLLLVPSSTPTHHTLPHYQFASHSSTCSVIVITSSYSLPVPPQYPDGRTNH